MLRIALIGYGKMGQAVETAALAEGHGIVVRIDRNGQALLTPDLASQTDVAIEFTRPESAADNILACLELGIPVVSGTTGWLSRLEEVKTALKQKNGALFYASNFSIGVNLLFAINRMLAQRMAGLPQYEVHLKEVHHVRKRDSPSGTAITLAEDILGRIDRKTSWVNRPALQPDELEIHAQRLDEVPGIHEVIYTSEVDTLTLRHEAHSREGFARGALLAAAWLPGKKGFFGMEDLLGG